MKNILSITSLITSLIISLPSLAIDRAKVHEEVQAMSKEEVWDALLLRDEQGRTRFGLCSVWFNGQIAYFGSSPSFYVQNGEVKWEGWRSGPATGTLGLPGWPKNPQSGDSTGIISQGCYPGYKPEMCTDDQKGNAKAMLLDALANERLEVKGVVYTDVCDLKNQPKKFKGVASQKPWGTEAAKRAQESPVRANSDSTYDDIEIKPIILNGKVIGETSEGAKVLFSKISGVKNEQDSPQLKRIQKLMDAGLVVVLVNACEKPAREAKVSVSIKNIKSLKELEAGKLSRHKCE